MSRTAEDSSESDPSERVPVVGIGASAGGLESLEQFFAHVPADAGCAFVVVQHLSPDFRSMMSELLARHTSMPIHVAEHGMPVAVNEVYVLPPRKEITIKNGRLQLADKDPTHALTLPIDLFFRSLAVDLRDQAVAIVLSGSGSDGSRGVRDVKRAGGRVMVESPELAKFDGMPLSSLATGVVDFTGSTAEIAGRITLEDDLAASQEDLELEASAGPLDAILALIRRQFGIDFAQYKRSTVSRRILRRVTMRGVELDDYVDQLRTDPEEIGALYHDLLIGVTQFFRDPDAFEVLEHRVIPDLLERVKEDEEVRVWVAGCATGEEAYSIAMLLYEAMTRADRAVSFKVMATDLHRASLEIAGAGVYGESELEHVSQERRSRFFSKGGAGYQISQDLRQRIVFAPHNVVQDAPFTRMHLISCRNLLIYLEAEAQRTVLSLFHFGLCTGGVLFMGSSESPGRLASEFETIDEHSKLYRKRRDARLFDPLRMPLASRALTAQTQHLAPINVAASPHLLPVYDRLLDRYMPPALLVDEERNLVDSFGGAERFLRLKGRRPSPNVLDMLEGDLRTVVAGAIQRALSIEGPVRYPGVHLASDRPQRVAITGESFPHPRTRGRYVLVTIDVSAQAAPSDGDSPAVHEAAGSQERMDILEGELAFTRETLQAAVEEQQTSNEELQATNEELIASNEELQSTNEELHSVNEELYTVNAEYQKKIVELRDVNNDIQHLLEGTDVAMLFLDHQLRIRRFTPRIASVFHVRPEDLGRSIRDFTHDLQRSDLYAEMLRTLENGTVVEDEVRDIHDTPFFLRILPYDPPAPISDDSGPPEPGHSTNRSAGVVLSLTDISALDHARERIRQLSAIVESSQDAIIGKDLQGVILSWNLGAERLYGYSAEEAIGQNIRMLAPPELESQISTFLEQLARGERIDSIETTRRTKEGKDIDISVTISPIRDSTGSIVGASAIARDITQLQAARREVEDREARIRMLLESTAEAILGIDANGVCTFCNPACIRLLALSRPEDIIGRRVEDVLQRIEDDGSNSASADSIAQVLRTAEGMHRDDLVFRRADGTSFAAEYWAHPVGDGSVHGAVVTFIDITDRRDAENQLRISAERREQFLAMLSHELRNPLAAVLSATRVLRASSADLGVGDRAREVIERQSRHMARLLDDLLDVSRITRGGVELRKDVVDLRAVIHQARESVEPLLDGHDNVLELDLPEEPLPVCGDSARLQQVFGNLLTNASKYSANGTCIRLRARATSDQIEVTVADEGIGIAEDLLPKVFDLFVQTEQGLDRASGGLGVGLALVRQLVGLHGGEVEAFSEGAGKGSVFRVRLPLKAQVAVDLEEDEPEAAPTNGSCRVVLVEDQDDARDMLRMLLEHDGHVVFEARDGRDAVEVIERVRPDVALVDIGLPKLDGYGVAREIRQSSGLDSVFLVALTGYGTEGDVNAARDAGFDDHLTKPADITRLRSLLTDRK